MYLEESVDNLPSHIVLVGLEECGFQQLVRAFGDIIIGLKIFRFVN